MRDLLLLRHGESEWNADGRWQGWIDVGLTPRGAEQARHRGRELAASGRPFDAVWASDLQRARDTGARLAAELGVDLHTNPGLRERHGGEWQGHTGDEIDARWPGVREAWRRDEVPSPPGGESDAQVLARVDAALARVVADTGGSDAIAVVTHGGVLHMLLRRAGVRREPRILENLGGHWVTWSSGAVVPGEPLGALPEVAVPGPLE